MSKDVSFEQKYGKRLGLIQKSPTPKKSRQSVVGDDCAICFSKLEQPIGRLLSVCRHAFCLECIVKWSERSNYCPLCKGQFKIIVSGSSDSAEIINVKTPKKDVEQIAIDDFFDGLVCQICREGGDDNRMLLCDGCDRGFHMFCLRPRLLRIPSGSWYCSQCRNRSLFNSP